jgi:hypothetical protein
MRSHQPLSGVSAGGTKLAIWGYGGFLAHRNPRESEHEPEVLRATRLGARWKASRDIRRAMRKYYSAEDKIRIVLEGLCGEESIEIIGK